MKCAILCVGTELLFGQTVNTNAVYLSKRLNEMGFDVLYHHTVGDNPERLKADINYLKKKVDIILTTGGLGPTEDDLTKEIIADAFGKKLYMDDKALEEMKKRFKRMNRDMTDNNIKQAYIPEGCECFYNSQGTAPGFALKDDKNIIISMPGPPREMKNMWEEHVRKYIAGFSDEQFYSKNLRFFGIGESKLETELIKFIHGQTDPTVATYAKDGQCTVRITSKHRNLDVAKEKVEHVTDEIKKVVGQYIYSEDNQELYEVVAKKLIDMNLKISSCESCTGGMFAETLTNVPGISQVFEESYVTYSNQAKIKLLGVSEDTLNKYSAVSEQIAREMAVGLKKKTSSDICISVTGLAGPDGGSEESPVGTVFIGLAYKDKVWCKKLKLSPNGRQYIRVLATLNMFALINNVISV